MTKRDSELSDLLELHRQFVDKTAILADVLPGLDVAVRIKDVRRLFNRVDVLVTPVAGHGDTWVSATRVILKAEG